MTDMTPPNQWPWYKIIISVIFYEVFSELGGQYIYGFIDGIMGK